MKKRRTLLEDLEKRREIGWAANKTRTIGVRSGWTAKKNWKKRFWGSGHAAAQHCCYDRQRRLLTRGSGARTLNFVSPELSAELHERIDILPWRLCRGDFSRIRPPNNDNRCETNPDDDEYRRQINNTKYY